jgi:hypothetical protein
MIEKKTFYLVSDSAHFFSAAFLVLLGDRLHFPWAVPMGIFIFAAIKEAFIDSGVIKTPLVENVDVRGSGVRDFLGYMAGIVVSLIIVGLTHA